MESSVFVGNWLHGEAVAAGTVMAADLSLRLGWIDQPLFDRTLRILKAAKLPVAPPEVGHPTTCLHPHQLSPLAAICQANYPSMIQINDVVHTGNESPGLGF